MKQTLILIGLGLLSSQTFAEGRFRERLKARMEEKRAVSSIEVNGTTREFKVHLPSTYQKEKPAPLLIALHGGGGNMNYQSDEKIYHLISKSDSDGFVVAFPNGYSRFRGKLATWNAGNCCGKARDTNSDDVAFIKALILKLESDYSIDKKRIYVTGMSNGGMMSYRLACELSDMITGIASVAGTDNTLNCKPSRPVSILHIHAKNDDHVLYNGGAGEQAFKDKSMVTNFVSVPSTIEKWVALNGCSSKPKRVLEKSGAWCDLYSGCKENVHIQLCVTESGGHSWPGGSKIRENKGEPPSTALSANDVMWEFFNQK